MAPYMATQARTAKEHWSNNASKGRARQRPTQSKCFASEPCKAVLNASDWPAVSTSPPFHGSEVGSGHWNKSLRVEKSEGVQIIAASACIDLEATNVDACNAVTELLDGADNAERHSLLMQLIDNKIVLELATSKAGCRVVQKALKVARGAVRDQLIAELSGHVTQLYESPHGNHVLSLVIKDLPAAKSDFIVSALLGQGIAVSMNRFGCRVVCRLLEHCSEEQIGGLLDEILNEADTLALHAFGNYVVQAAIEHAVSRRSAIVSQLLPSFATLCAHRSGSLVAQRVLDYCDDDAKTSAIYALLQGDDQTLISDVAGGIYGSFVIEQIAQMHHSAAKEASRYLVCNLQLFQTSVHAERVITALGYAPAESLAHMSSNEPEQTVLVYQ